MGTNIFKFQLKEQFPLTIDIVNEAINIKVEINFNE